MKKTKTETLAAAMDVLSREIQSGDGVANAAIAEAAERLRELAADEKRMDWLERLDCDSPLWDEIRDIINLRDKIDDEIMAAMPNASS